MKSINLFTWSTLSLAALVQATPTPASATKPRWGALTGFAYADKTQFKVDGKNYSFASSNVYWLSQLNSNDDIVTVLKDAAAQNSKVIRTWCFRDVVGTAPSDSGSYTGLWKNGKHTLNQAGLDRITYILDQADQLGLKVHCALTNNWSPTYPADSPRPLGYYSNSYGGVDTYVQQLKPGGHHDDFFTDSDIKAAYKTYIKFIVSALKDKSSLFAWELINDPRCVGAVGSTTSGNCKTTTITKWVNEFASYVKSIDPHHLLSAGDHGFFCNDPDKCPKINSHSSRSVPEPRWHLGSAFDGTFGVDTEDINNSPNVDFSAFGFFPDQESYGAGQSAGPPPGGISGSHFAATVQHGLDWIDLHAALSKSVGKPSTFTGFGFVSEDVVSDFEPFNSVTTSGVGPSKRAPLITGVQVQQKQDATTQITTHAGNQNTGGIGNYQESTTGLQSKKGSVVDDSNTSGSNPTEAKQKGKTPNDGYANGSAAMKNIFTGVGASQNAK